MTASGALKHEKYWQFVIARALDKQKKTSRHYYFRWVFNQSRNRTSQKLNLSLHTVKKGSSQVVEI